MLLYDGTLEEKRKEHKMQRLIRHFGEIQGTYPLAAKFPYLLKCIALYGAPIICFHLFWEFFATVAKKQTQVG